MVTVISTNSQLLKWVYIMTCGLCIFMIIWILVLPSSAFQDSNIFQQNSQFLHSAAKEMQKNRNNFLPRDLLTKYKGHTAVHLTHTLPGALWMSLIPFQLHPGIRKSHRTLHRITGYIFFLSTILITIGIFIIIQRDLVFEHYLDDKDANTKYITRLGILQILWFSWSAGSALLQAKKKRFYCHQKWIIRHIAAGIWVAIQRVLIAVSSPIISSFDIFIDNSQLVQRHYFEKIGFSALVISFVIGEICIVKIDEIKTIEKKKVV